MSARILSPVAPDASNLPPFRFDEESRRRAEGLYGLGSPPEQAIRAGIAAGRPREERATEPRVPLICYLAGASADLETCELYRDRLRQAGIEVVRDWMADVRQNLDIGRRDREISAEERARYARADLDGVRCADVFWLLIPSNTSIGCWVELGYAQALTEERFSDERRMSGDPVDPEIVCSGPWRSIFTDPVRRLEEHEQAFEWIVARAKAVSP